MTDIVERVARAIEAKMFAPDELPLDAALHAKYRDTARAAIAAMREPTDAMMNAGPGFVHIAIKAEIWQAMIDAALEGK